jgi:hypothetical protein
MLKGQAMLCDPLKSIVFITALFLTFSAARLPVYGAEPELHIGKFSAADLNGWKEETIWNTKKSSYTFIKENGKSVMVGKAVNAASGMLHKITVDPKSYPIIRWSWKIDHTVKKGNERSKSGHDFAVRVYVVFSRGFFSRTRAIEYVWGNVMAKGETLRSPYTNNAVMIAVDSGNESAGKWVTHRRNYADDYRAAFGEEAPKVGAIAIMTDADNTGESVVGYYGDIDLLAAAKEEEPRNGERKTKEVPRENHLKPLPPLPTTPPPTLPPPPEQPPAPQPPPQSTPPQLTPQPTVIDTIRKEPAPVEQKQNVPPLENPSAPVSVPENRPAIPEPEKR